MCTFLTLGTSAMKRKTGTFAFLTLTLPEAPAFGMHSVINHQLVQVVVVASLVKLLSKDSHLVAYLHRRAREISMT